MTVEKNLDSTTLTVSVGGRLDTTTASELDKEINDSIAGVTSLILDLKELDYISSAGLRVILSAQKTMTKQGGTMVVKNVNEVVNEILEVTGFNSILTIE